MGRRFWVAAFAAALVGCGGGGGGDDSAGPPIEAGPTLSTAYLPLAEGYRWSSRDASDVLSTRAVVAGRPGIEGTVWTVQEFAFGQIAAYQIEAGARAVRQLPDGGDAFVTAIGAYDLMRFPMRTGDRYTQFETSFDLDVDGDGRNDRVRAVSVVELVGFARRDTRAGSFDASAQLRTTVDIRVAFAGGPTVDLRTIADEWYAPGIGLIDQRIRTSTDGAPTGTTTDTLVAWRSAAGRSESQAPILLSTSPPPGSSRAPTAALRLAFSETMDPLSMRLQAIEVRRVADGALVPGGRVVGSTTLGWNPSEQPLPAGEYEARLSGDLVDLAGNAVAVAPWRFRIDPAAPAFAAATPAPGAQDVPLETALRVTLDELPGDQVGAVSASLRDGRSFQVPITVAVDGRQVVVTPTGGLQRAQSYTLELWVRDRDNNTIAGPSQIAFTTDGGMFRTARSLPPVGAVLGVAVADVDGDGRADILQSVWDGSAAGLDWLRLRTDGQFERTRLMSGRIDDVGRQCDTYELRLHDLDGDGRPELLRVGTGCGVEVLGRAADGAWSRLAWVPEPLAARVRAADLDGDARAELLVAVPDEIQVWAWPAGGAPVLRETVGFPKGAFEVPPVDHAAADTDGDGRLDLLIVRGGDAATGGGLYWRSQLAGGGWAPAQSRPGGDRWSPRRMAVGDLDSDGRADAVAASGGNSPTYLPLWRQSAGGGFAPTEPLLTLDLPEDLLIRDLDGDGRADLVVLHPSWANVGVYRQDGQGRLVPELLFPVAYGSIGLAAGDLDGDGLVDLVTGNAVLLQKR